MTQPDAQMIRLALFQAAHSPCRSKRGATIYADVPGTGPVLLGAGHNGPPRGGECPGRAVCAGTCGKRSVHAEVRAIRLVQWPQPRASELVHVELGADGDVVPCDGPACWQCSREILDAGFIDGVWLYEAVPEEHCPHLVELRRIDCPLCQGEACNVCHRGPGRPRCDHDVLDRHGDLPTVNERWRRYSAAEFHRVTLQRCGILTGGGSL